MNRGGANPSRRHLLPVASLSRLPYWLLVVMLLGVLAVWSVVREEDYRVIFRAVSRGIVTTLYVSVISYAAAAAIGLLFGLMRASHRRVLREAASVYIEVVRGVPMLVILYYVAFVAAPALVVLINRLAEPLIAAGWLQPLSVRRIDFVWRAIIALTVGYSAFLAEIFRAGIEAVPRGQLEAALSLGMSRRQAMLRVVLPQAARTVLPPLGNDFVAMIKDSALVSVLGVQDITQQAKVYSASSFRFFETYNTVAFLYLVLTISLSLLVRGLERRLRRHVSTAHPVGKCFSCQNPVVDEGADDYPRRDVEVFDRALDVIHGRDTGTDHGLQRIIRTQKLLGERSLELLLARAHVRRRQEPLFHARRKMIGHQAGKGKPSTCQ